MHATFKYWSIGFGVRKGKCRCIRKVISACKIIKRLREKSKEHQGLK